MSVPPDRIPGIVKELETLDKRVERRHEENEQRFDRIENSLSATVATLKLAVLLLVANAGLLVWVGSSTTH